MRLTGRSLSIKIFRMIKRRLLGQVSPLWLGFGISGFFLVVLLVTETMLGRWSEVLIGGEFDALADVSAGVLRDLRLAFVHCLVRCHPFH